MDVCVLAGDIAVGDGIGGAMDLFCEKYPEVVYVHGNHEYYQWPRQDVLSLTAAAADRHGNLHWLDCGAAVIGGVRFLGAPLWFSYNQYAPRKQMADFHAIMDFESWVYEENARAKRFLRQHVSRGDIVVTHHLPSQRSVSARFKHSPLNPFFVCDLESLIGMQQPRLWLHGHTHDSLDYRIGKTRVVCNPFGYARGELNHAFEEHKLLNAETVEAEEEWAAQ